MVLSLICLVIIVGSVLLGATMSARRERRLPPHLAFLSEDEPVEQDGRFPRLRAWLRSLVTEPDGGYGGWSSGGGFGGFGGCGGGGGGGGGGCGGGGGGGGGGC